MKQNDRMGFSLIELLVVVGVVALLVSIAVPVLSSAQGRARLVGSEVNLRSISQAFDLYINDAKDMYPASVPGVSYQTPRASVQSTLGHWQSSERWNLLFEQRYPWASHEKFYLAPGARRDISLQPVNSTIFPSYVYSASFLGNPKIWSGDLIADDEWESLVQSVRKPSVRFPSSKVLLWDVELPTIRRDLQKDSYSNLNEQSPMVFADGHTETRVPAEANQGMTNWAPSASNPHQFLHNTRDGVFGRDY